MKVYHQIIRSHRFFFILTLTGIFMAGLYTNMNLYLIWTKSDGGDFGVTIQRIVIYALMILVLYVNLFFLLREFLRVCISELSVLLLCGLIWQEIMQKYMFSLAQYGIPLILITNMFFVAVICEGDIMTGILCTTVTWGIMMVFYLICMKMFTMAHGKLQKDFG